VVPRWHARGQGFKSPQLHKAQCGAAVAHHAATDGARAGQGAGDAVHDLDAGDHQPAQLIQTGRLHLAMTS
jgi:hypothetical protein